MTNTSGPLSNPLDSDRTEALCLVARLAQREGVPIMLFGAFARDVHFYHAHNVECPRATQDVDTSIQVADWGAYDLFGTLLEQEGFKHHDPTHPEKFAHDGTGVELDVLPCGPIAADGDVITWPTDDSPWSTLGFDDAFRSALSLPLSSPGHPPLNLAVASVPAIVLLKLVAIMDRPDARHKRDGRDIAFSVAKYLDIGNRERLLQGDDADIMGLVQGDLTHASAMLLGRDMGRTFSPGVLSHTGNFLEHEAESSSRCHLVRGMMSHSGSFPWNRGIVKALLRGLRHGAPSSSE